MATIAGPISRTLTVNGLTLRYLEWGAAEAPAVVCVHGYTSSAEAFNALARRLQHRRRLIAMDVRGHGDSAWALGGTYRYPDQVADLASLADYLHLERFILIGTSMGGLIAMAYAGTNADRLAGLVVNDIGPDPEAAGVQRIVQMVGERPERFTTLEDAMAYRRHVSPIVASRPLDDQRELALGVLRQQPDGTWGWKMDPGYIRQRVEDGSPPRPVLWPVLERLSCPTLIVWGTDSDVLSETQARRMVAALPKGELMPVAGVGHAPTLVEPVVLTALERFLGA
jgi:esterase